MGQIHQIVTVGMGREVILKKQLLTGQIYKYTSGNATARVHVISEDHIENYVHYYYRVKILSCSWQDRHTITNVIWTPSIGTWILEESKQDMYDELVNILLGNVKCT